MTIVASLFIQRCPILIGDLLISSPDKNDKFCLPTINDNLPKIDIENMNVPVGLRQKAVVINNNLAVCWANSVFYAKRVIKDLVSEYKDKICSIDEMMHYLDNIDPEIRENVSIVGMLRHNNLFHAFGFNCRNKQLNDNGDIIYIAGSGTEEFLQTFDTYNLQPQENLNPLQHAVSTLIAQYNYMMCKEISSIDSLVNCYGGGYELISYMNGGFQKIDDITHVIWIANENENGAWTLQLPKLIMHYCPNVNRINSVGCWILWFLLLSPYP